MFTTENAIRTIKGVEQKVRVFFGKGRLSANPPVIRDAKGHKLISAFGFSLVIDMGKNEDGSKKPPKYFPLILWDNNAENMSKLGYKGQPIIIAGRLEKQKYKNREGEDRELEVLIVERFECLQYKPKEEKKSDNEVIEENTASEESVNEFDEITSDNSVEISKNSNEAETNNIDDIPF